MQWSGGQAVSLWWHQAPAHVSGMGWSGTNSASCWLLFYVGIWCLSGPCLVPASPITKSLKENWKRKNLRWITILCKSMASNDEILLVTGQSFGHCWNGFPNFYNLHKSLNGYSHSRVLLKMPKANFPFALDPLLGFHSAKAYPFSFNNPYRT